MELRQIGKGILYAFLIALFIRVFIVDIFSVNGDSMSPTIVNGEYVIVNRVAYLFNTPKRGDIVVSKTREEGIKVVKRIMGLPEDRLEVFGKNGQVVAKKDRRDVGEIVAGTGALVTRDTDSLLDDSSKNTFRVDPYEYFVLGDDREVSIDSRRFGAIDAWDIKGKVIFKFNLKTFSLSKLE